MTALLPTPELQFLDENGIPYSGGTLAFFIPGTLTAKNTWRDAGQVTLNTNPIVLDMAGRAVVFGLGDYRAQLHDEFGNLIFDQLTTSSLPESAVSAFMLPVLGAANSATALGLLGVTAAIASAIAAVELLPGPTGPAGAASTVPGPMGPTGPAGAAGAAGSSGVTSVPNYGDIGSYTMAIPLTDVNPPSGFAAGTEVDGGTLTWAMASQDEGGVWVYSYPSLGLTGTWRVMSTNNNGGPWLCLRIA